MDSAVNNKKLQKRLDDIAEKLKNGKNYEDLIEELDCLLDTGMVERDQEAEEIFEKNKEE
jgi:hypothetical protein